MRSSLKQFKFYSFKVNLININPGNFLLKKKLLLVCESGGDTPEFSKIYKL